MIFLELFLKCRSYHGQCFDFVLIYELSTRILKYTKSFIEQISPCAWNGFKNKKRIYDKHEIPSLISSKTIRTSTAPEITEIHRKASKWNIYFEFLVNISSLFSFPFFGTLSFVYRERNMIIQKSMTLASQIEFVFSTLLTHDLANIYWMCF